MNIKPYHITIRPRLENLPDKYTIEKMVTKKLGASDYFISLEKGDSKGPERFNHYDIVCWIPSRRRDSIKRSILSYLKFDEDDDQSKNFKVHEIELPRVYWQIGYCGKEQVECMSNLPLKQRMKCLEIYRENPDKYKDVPEDGRYGNKKKTNKKEALKDFLDRDYKEHMEHMKSPEMLLYLKKEEELELKRMKWQYEREHGDYIRSTLTRMDRLKSIDGGNAGEPSREIPPRVQYVEVEM